MPSLQLGSGGALGFPWGRGCCMAAWQHSWVRCSACPGLGWLRMQDIRTNQGCQLWS